MSSVSAFGPERLRARLPESENLSQTLGLTTLIDVQIEPRRGERTRAAVLSSAIERFGRDGYRPTSVLAIARAAGLGSTAAYSYFPTKESLFLAAVDEDVAGVVEETFGGVGYEPHAPQWPARTLAAAMTSLEHHPLARRVLAGKEPEATHRLTGTPALAEARKSLAERLRVGQERGDVRCDISAEDLAGGLTGIMVALLAAGVRVGTEKARRADRERLDAVLRTLHASVVPGDRERNLTSK
jgi:AcrR family transcriptional regulator